MGDKHIQNVDKKILTLIENQGEGALKVMNKLKNAFIMIIMSKLFPKV
jgi:hypothetical protein